MGNVCSVFVFLPLLFSCKGTFSIEVGEEKFPHYILHYRILSLKHQHSNHLILTFAAVSTHLDQF